MCLTPVRVQRGTWDGGIIDLKDTDTVAQEHLGKTVDFRESRMCVRRVPMGPLVPDAGESEVRSVRSAG